jgi:hypothetical protein
VYRGKHYAQILGNSCVPVRSKGVFFLTISASGPISRAVVNKILGLIED